MFSMPSSLQKEVFYGFHHWTGHNGCVSVGYRIQLRTTERRKKATCVQAGRKRSFADILRYR